MPRVSINLDRELYQRLEAAVGRSEIPDFIHEAVAERLDDWDYGDDEEAMDGDSELDYQAVDHLEDDSD